LSNNGSNNSKGEKNNVGKSFHVYVFVLANVSNSSINNIIMIVVVVLNY